MNDAASTEALITAHAIEEYQRLRSLPRSVLAASFEAEFGFPAARRLTNRFMALAIARRVLERHWIRQIGCIPATLRAHAEFLPSNEDDGWSARDRQC